MLLFSPSFILFSSTLMMGTFISISSSSWFVAWLGLELNLLSFIPLITSKRNTFSSEAALKYFLVQTLGSATLLASVSMLFLFKTSPNILILCSLTLKMGAAPLHFWLPTIMQGMSWQNCLILMTVQKVAPIVLTSYILSPQTSFIVMMISMLSALLGGIGGLNQTLLRKLMAYSSINHMAWMLAAISMNTNLWVHYIFAYIIISISLVNLLNFNQAYHIKHLANPSCSQLNKIVMFLTLFSLGGLPPFLGFLPKMSVVKDLINQGLLLLAFVLTMSALITLFYYVRLSITALTLATPKTSQNINYADHKASTATLLNLLPILFPMTLMIPI
uniref:NADH dehydrogenase subunit 2 n=1 Tax=Palaemon adspersus TaxID=1169710 RepID=UPI00161139DD|nr:NADH dehydrogenase subunit 2 [Palaemon adspersus]QLM01580.1 NADH dehydrogenase subunit 2 [Palaemon adspersus]